MLLELFELRRGLLAGLLGKGGLVDPLFELGHLVAAVLALAELLLDRLHLLVEVILALRLLHLPLDAVADPLFDLKDADLAFHVAEYLFEPLRHRFGFEQFLLFRNLQAQMRGDRIGELGRLVDLVDRDQHLGRDLFVELDVLLELGHHGAPQRLHLLGLARLLDDRIGIGLEERLVLGKAGDPGPARALDQYLDRAIRQLQQLQHRADGADGIDVGGSGIVLRRVLLGDQQDLLVILHHVLERPHRLFAADKQRHDHVREDDDVAEGQDRIKRTAHEF